MGRSSGHQPPLPCLSIVGSFDPPLLEVIGNWKICNSLARFSLDHKLLLTPSFVGQLRGDMHTLISPLARSLMSRLELLKLSVPVRTLGVGTTLREIGFRVSFPGEVIKIEVKQGVKQSH